MCDCSIFNRFGQLRGKVDSHTDSNSETHCDPDANSETERHAIANPDTRADGDADSDSDADRDDQPLPASGGLSSHILEHEFARKTGKPKASLS